MVRLQDPISKTWKRKGKIVELISDRTYQVESDGRTLHRGRHLLRPLVAPLIDAEIAEVGDETEPESVLRRSARQSAWDEAKDESECRPRTKVGFLKTHKTASSTIQNILLRFGLNHNLNFALPMYGNHLIKPGSPLEITEPFQAQWLKEAPWHSRLIAHERYDIMAIHTMWNYDQFKLVLGSSAVLVTILRDPSKVFESLFSYTNFQEHYQMNISTFIHRSQDEKFRQNRLLNYLGLNQQLWDLGLKYSTEMTSEFIGSKIEEFSSQFDLVLIAELMDESIVLLADLLCAPLEEMGSLKINARKDSVKLNVTRTDLAKLKELQRGDEMLYNHFKSILLDKIDAFGPSEMREQVNVLKTNQQNIVIRCLAEEKTKEDLRGTKFEPFHKDTIAFSVEEDQPDCANYAISENSFIDAVRVTQSRKWTMASRLQQMARSRYNSD
eukprot:maker-scaffold534_size144770-snap-gene-0.26 protein:Tk11141 transcript:maker-scaffold534_size144770-snap-gene-0.26-mRNA-1 annotation:"galactosylceramide sulfotransferase-like"